MKNFVRTFIMMLALLAGRVTASELHPAIKLLDKNGRNVLNTGEPVSTYQTCNGCHDVNYIEKHSFHTTAGLAQFRQISSSDRADGLTKNLFHSWDRSTGLFGRWDPNIYRLLSDEVNGRMDLGTPEWLMTYGLRHVGGGPAVYGSNGMRLDEGGSTDGIDNYILDPETGEVKRWDWQKSGVVEMNCFLCHTVDPANDARVEELAAGRFKWANTATLKNTGIVSKSEDGWVYNTAAFDNKGDIGNHILFIQDPKNENCGACHGDVHASQRPYVPDYGNETNWSTQTKGEVFTGQRISESAVNIKDKGKLTRSWDIHSERVFECVGCHYSTNNPVYYREINATKPDHLLFDGRRLSISQYLKKPNHNFVKGQSTQRQTAAGLNASMRRCESCHNVESTHNWLPYKARHLETLSCEACHIPKLYAPARMQNDWTVIDENARPVVSYRGVSGDINDKLAFVTSYVPVMLQRYELDGKERYLPHNIISSWYWVGGKPERPVRLVDLKSVFLQNGVFRKEIVDLFDADENGKLEKNELKITSSEQSEYIVQELKVIGYENPRIKAEMRPYSINHNISHNEWALGECTVCHAKDSKINRSFLLASHVPAGVVPELIQNTNVAFYGKLKEDENGQLLLEPNAENENLYVLGSDRSAAIDMLGLLIIVGVFVGVVAHSIFRIISHSGRKA